MEQILKEANDIIIKQKNQIDQLKNNTDLKEKVKELENEHIKERRESQREFNIYKQAMSEKEAHLEKEYKEKSMDMRENL
jgi:hypothetical protein